MGASTRFLLAVFLLTGLWTWSGAAGLCVAGVEFSAAQTCCPEDCKCDPAACGCSMAPSDNGPARGEAPTLLPEVFQGPSDLSQASIHPVAASPAPAAVGAADRSAWVAFAAKHTDVLLELLCIQIV